MADEPVQQEKKEDAIKGYWRPAMGWLYMVMCAFDFIVFPLVNQIVPIITKIPYKPWESLTLSNGGMIHLAFGAILGVAAWSRGQEKMAGADQAKPAAQAPAREVVRPAPTSQQIG
jgi:hypothetical protein